MTNSNLESQVTWDRRRLRLIDLVALVVGYGLAALLIRAFWPSAGVPSGGVSLVLGGLYLWLGLAMGGPLVLFLDRRAGHVVKYTRVGRLSSDPSFKPQSKTLGSSRSFPDALQSPISETVYTRAELAWLLIGGYWIALALLVVPTRMSVDPTLGVLPIVATLGLRWLRPQTRRVSSESLSASWTHRAAIVLLITWPLAWISMILLGKTLV